MKLLRFDPYTSLQEASKDTSSSATISIAQFYEIVKTYDKSFFENPRAVGRAEREKEIKAKAEFSKAMDVLEQNKGKETNQPEYSRGSPPKEKVIMTDKFTHDNRSIEQLLDDYERQKQEIQSRSLDEISTEEDLSLLPAEDQKLLSDYDADKELLRETLKALDFTKSSTVQLLYMDSRDGVYKEGCDELRVSSLMDSKSDYAKAVVTLTGGFDKRMMDVLEAQRTEPYHSETMSLNEYRATVNAPLADADIKSAIAEEIGGGNVMKDKTVADLADEIKLAKELREQHNIRDENIIDDTASAVLSAEENGTLHVLSVRYYDNTAEQEKEPVEIVESNDGYVMNTSEKITAENNKELSDIHNVENVNEVRHEPKETTNSGADVRANVKLESARDIGTKEQAEIDAGYGTDADIEIAARTSEAYEARTDRAVSKQKSRGEER